MGSSSTFCPPLDLRLMIISMVGIMRNNMIVEDVMIMMRNIFSLVIETRVLSLELTMSMGLLSRSSVNLDTIFNQTGQCQMI